MERDFRRLEFQGRVCGILPPGEFELPFSGRLAFTLPFHQDMDLRRRITTGRVTFLIRIREKTHNPEIRLH